MILVFSLSIVLFSIAGIPPLAGFFSKLMILESLIDKNHIFIALLAVIFSSVACFYYIRLIKVIFFTKDLLIHSL